MKGTKPQLREAPGDVVTTDTRAPDWLSKEAREEWDRVMPVLIDRKILTDADLGGLESYCICIGRVRQMETLIQAESDAAAMLPMIRAQDKAMVHEVRFYESLADELVAATGLRLPAVYYSGKASELSDCQTPSRASTSNDP